MPLTNDEKRLQEAFRMTTARKPLEDELSALQRALSKYQAHFAQNESKAKEVVSVGEAPRDETLDTSNHAAWATLCLMLLNLDETLTKE